MMKNMKTYRLLAFACTAVLGLSACSSDDDDTDVNGVDLDQTAPTADLYVNPATLSQGILDYISTNYPEIGRAHV